jgi:hypothetical protein
VHDLRHLHAARFREKAHPKAIQVRLGHASIKTTLDTYGHPYEGIDEAVAEALDANWRKATEPGDAGGRRLMWTLVDSWSSGAFPWHGAGRDESALLPALLGVVEVVQALSDPSNPASRLIATWDGQPIRPVAQPTRTAPRLIQLQNRLSPEQIDQLIAAYRAGDTQKELATTFHIAKTTVAAHLQRAGVLRPRSLSPDQVTEASRLYREGASLSQLGEHFHFDPKTVWSALRKAGVSIRPRPGWLYE